MIEREPDEFMTHAHAWDEWMDNVYKMRINETFPGSNAGIEMFVEKIME